VLVARTASQRPGLHDRHGVVRGHALLYRKALAKCINSGGPLDAAAIDTLARRLATALPAA